MTNNFDAGDLTGMFDTYDIEQNKLMAAIAYIPLLFLIPLFAAGNSKYAKFHANQGLILTGYSFICGIINGFIGFLISWIPFIGPVITGLVTAVLGISVVGLMAYGIIYTVQGKAKKLPVIGGLIDAIK